jgi:hypothetical protein
MTLLLLAGITSLGLAALMKVHQRFVFKTRTALK